MDKRIVQWKRHHHSNAGPYVVSYTGEVQKEFANGVLFVKVTAVDHNGITIPAWGYQKVNKRRVKDVQNV